MECLVSTENFRIVKLNDVEDTFLKVILKMFHADITVLTPTSDKPIIQHKEHSQLSYIEKGSGITALNGKTISVSEKTLVLFQPNVTHAFVASTPEFVIHHLHLADTNTMGDRFILDQEILLNKEENLYE